MGYHLRPSAFDMSTDKACRRVDLNRTADLFFQEYPGYGLGAALQAVLDDGGYADWRQVRNHLAHRAVPQRRMQLTIGVGITSHSWPLLGVELDAGELEGRLGWLSSTLTTLLTRMWDFGNPEIAVPGAQRIRAGQIIKYP
jgi:hypothetical protein